MTKKLLILCFTLLLSGSLLAQSDWSDIDYHNRRTLAIGVKYVNMSNPADPANQVSLNRIYPDLDMMTTMRFSKGAWSSSYRNKLISDFFGMAFEVIFKNDLSFFRFREYTTGINNFIGWWNFTKNVYLDEKLAISVGAHFGDYFLDYSLDLASHQQDIRTDPHGFYIAAGPAFMIDYRVLGDYIIHFESGTAYAQLLAAGSGNGPYPAPIILNNILEFRTNYKLYAGIEYVTFINRGASEFRGQRLELKVGYRWSRR